MKTLISFTIMLLISLCSFSQELSEANVDDELFLCLNMHPEQSRYKNIRVLFSKHKAKRFLKKLRRYCDTTEKWTRKAFDNNVSRVRKSIHGTIRFTHLEFVFDNSQNTSNGYFMVPAFDVDDEGRCYLLLRGYYKGRNTTPYIVSFREGDKQRYQQLSEFNYYLRIPSNELESWYRRVASAVTRFEINHKNYKKVNKLFVEN